MRERPIIFRAQMIRALLDGRKTQTRRLVKPRPDSVHGGEPYWHVGGYRAWTFRPTTDVLRKGTVNPLACPYGKPGDLLFVREPWQYYGWTDDGEPQIRYAADEAVAWPRGIPDEYSDRLMATWERLSADDNVAIDGFARDRRWRPSIHMPRWASRITLRITDVRVQRLQEISEADAMAEGVPFTELPQGRTQPDALHRAQFADLWCEIYGGSSFDPTPWDKNPWVWALTFEVLHGNVDAVARG